MATTILVNSEKVMDTVNKAIAHAVFDKVDVMIFYDSNEDIVKFTSDELLFDAMQGYVIRHSKYNQNDIPKGGDEEDADGLNSFSRWLANELFTHSNAMHEHLWRMGYYLKNN